MLNFLKSILPFLKKAKEVSSTVKNAMEEVEEVIAPKQAEKKSPKKKMEASPKKKVSKTSKK